MADPDAVRRRDSADLARLARFLPEGEGLTWSGRPQTSRFFLRAIALTILMALIASPGIYVFALDLGPNDICGENMRGRCGPYVWAWMGLAVAAISTPLVWLSFLAHASGLLREFYGLTDRQALKLAANPFDRFQSVNLGTLTATGLAARKRFGTVAFGPVAFLCLRDDAIGAVERLARGSQTVNGGSQDGPANGGARR